MSWLFLFFCISGFCSILYEIIWLRLAMASFGVTSAPVSIVLSVFMAGLGLGSLASVRYVVRRWLSVDSCRRRQWRRSVVWGRYPFGKSYSPHGNFERRRAFQHRSAARQAHRLHSLDAGRCSGMLRRGSHAGINAFSALPSRDPARKSTSWRIFVAGSW